MKKHNLSTPFLLQRLALILFAIFPVALSIIAQTLLIANTWNVHKLFQFGLLVIIFLTPIFVFSVKKGTWTEIREFKILPIIWVVGLAIVLRIVFVQVISTDFVSDMEDVHFFAIDLSAKNPMANLDKYPNIPGATHLNMSALILSFVYRLFGASTATAKMFIVILGGLTTLLVYLAGQEISNTQVGFLAAFLFATLPSTICYSGVLVGDHFALPLMMLAIYIYARANKLDDGKFFSAIFHFTIIGILVGLVHWFRPFGIILVVALIISLLLYGIGQWKFRRLLVILVVILFAYSQTSNLAVTISENIFHVKIFSASQRIGEFLLKGLNPDSKGIITLEDDATANEVYQTFGDDRSSAQLYLLKLAVSRLEQGEVEDLLKEKFILMWSSHDALFDYSLAGSNNQELVDLMRAFETLLYWVVSVFMLYHAVRAIFQRSNQAIFVMQLFILGFAILLLVVEVQNRYVAIVIPYSVLLGVLGMHDAFPKVRSFRP